jgi:hypothetical protein
MTKYSFVTHWELDAPLGAVWDEIAAPLKWPEWWRGVEQVVEMEKGDPDGVGSLNRYTWKSVLPYRLTFDMRTTRVEKHRRIEGTAAGELQGTGLWTFTDAGSSTVVRYDWIVETTKAWMDVLSPIARPLFAWNHDVVMRWGAEGLRDRIAERSSPRAAPSPSHG